MNKNYKRQLTVWSMMMGMLLLALSCQQSEKEALPNVLLILSDDHSYPYLSAYGHPDLETPFLDQLADEGVLFTNAYTAAPQCVPSRASILSGRNVIDIRMMRFSAPLPKDVKTIPDYLRQKGYYTGICGRHYHLDGSGKKASETISTFEKYDMITFPDRVDYLKVGTDKDVLSQFQTFLNQVPEGKPFFMWMNYSDPHRPFTADDFRPDPAEITIPSSMPDISEVREDMADHLAEINRLDYHVGKVLGELADRGLADNTMVIFIGDNGAALLRGKGTLYDLGLHVPLIMKWPGHIAAGQTVDVLVSGEDLLPTILDAVDLEPHTEVTGKSILPVLNSDTPKHHSYIFAQRTTHGSGLPTQSAWFDVVRTVFNEDYKLIYNVTWRQSYIPVDFNNSPMWKRLHSMNQEGSLEEKISNAIFTQPRPIFELFDRRNDPHEFFNLIEHPDYQEVAHELKAALQEWMIVNQDYANLPIPPTRN